MLEITFFIGAAEALELCLLHRSLSDSNGLHAPALAVRPMCLESSD